MNEILFFGFTLFLLCLSLLAFRMGKVYIFVLIAIFSLLMNIFVTKQFQLFGFAITGGNAFYGSIFLLTDMLSEHYGKKEAFRSVVMGFLVTLVFVVSTQVLLAFQPNEFDFSHGSLETLFSVTPRILLGSLLAYIIAQSFDVWMFEQIKKWTGDKYLFLRNNGSTLFSQAIDTLIFTVVGLTAFSFLPFGGIISVEVFWEVTLATYLIKLFVALIDTPFLYLSRWMKLYR